MMVAMTTKGMAAIYSIRKEAMSKLTKSQIHEARKLAPLLARVSSAAECHRQVPEALAKALDRFAVTGARKC